MPDKTSLAESSQALLCAVADYIGKPKTNQIFNIKENDNYGSFKTAVSKVGKKVIDIAHKRIETPGVSLKQISDFLSTDEKWYISSVLIAKKLINEISLIDSDLKIAPSGFQKLFYFRL